MSNHYHLGGGDFLEGGGGGSDESNHHGVESVAGRVAEHGQPVPAEPAGRRVSDRSGGFPTLREPTRQVQSLTPACERGANNRHDTLLTGLMQSGRLAHAVPRNVRCSLVGRGRRGFRSLGEGGRTPPPSVERRDPACPP